MKIEAKCAICKSIVFVSLKKAAEDKAILSVTPCNLCMTNRYDDGDYDGFERGMINATMPGVCDA